MRPYSTDLRTRVVASHEAGEGSIRELAEWFKLAKNTVENWLGLVRKTGDVAPRPHGGGVAPTLRGERLDVLRRLVDERKDATLDELRHALEQQCHIQTSRSAVDRALVKMKITRKRRRSTRTSGNGRRFSTLGQRSAWSR